MSEKPPAIEATVSGEAVAALATSESPRGESPPNKPMSAMQAYLVSFQLSKSSHQRLHY